MSSGLVAGGARDRSWPVSQTEFSGAVVTQPDDDVRSVRPEKRTDSARHLHRMIHPKTLQCLNVECAVVELAFGALIPVNTLSFAKHLSRHDESPPSPP